jgi:hypothetical protein
MKTSSTNGEADISAVVPHCAAPRSTPAFIIWIVGTLAFVGLAAIVMIVANAREPYGGPLEA